MTIRNQIVYVGKKPVVQSPKSGKPREIVLIDETVELLKRHKKEQAEMRLKYGPWEDDDITRDLVFRQRDGRIYGIQILARPVAHIAEVMGIKLHPHDLRHSYAVAALRSGIDVKTVQNNLGHAKAGMTLDTYAKYTDDMGRAAADKFAAYWSESTKLGSN